MNRQKLLLTFALVALLIACGYTFRKRTFKGDLYFKLVNIGSTYNADSASVKKFNKGLDSLLSVDKKKLSKENLVLLEVYGGLKKNGLIDKPFFNLRIDSTTTYLVYTTPFEFEKIKDYHHHDLLNERKKVQIELTGEIINVGQLMVINCTKINKVQKVDGITYWKK